VGNGCGREVDIVAHRVQLGVGLYVFCELDCWLSVRARNKSGRDRVGYVLVSPASPENAISVCLFRARVLSSEALRMVAPRIAALEAAMMVKSLPVMPSKTSLWSQIR